MTDVVNDHQEEDSKRNDLLRQIQKSFKVTEQCLRSWTNGLKDSDDVIANIKNLSEQYVCVRAVQPSDPVLVRMPDLRTCLLTKIAQNIDAKMACLYEKLSLLQKTCERMSKQCEYVSACHLRADLNIDMMTSSTVLCPSPAELMERLVDIEKAMWQQFWTKQYLLETFTITDDDSKTKLFKEWHQGESKMVQNVNDTLKLVSFLLEFNFSGS
ncbi:hypothetical protein FSP39_000207 [Pinctada imbricata]|uniref:Uncharacterized protein n=1 Tax=Pinctada imbricata TaxID=66713 RepID=A0AA88XYI9_PINIB|nr:hypothetical protein FSP39_000207 [Pinctada imbricata]